MLATAFSFVMLGFGGAGGLINMSYQLDATIHNTQWITGHFHLIFGGAIVIMYFAIAYDLWPHLTGRALARSGLMRAQLWLWFVGMIVTTLPLALGRHPRHAAAHGVLRLRRSRHRAAGLFGDALGDRRRSSWCISGLLFLSVLIRGQAQRRPRPAPIASALAVHHADDAARRR